MVQVSSARREGLLFAATPDYMSRNEFATLARSLARYVPEDEAGKVLAKAANEVRSGQEFLDIYGIEDARIWNPEDLWDSLTPASRLKIPLGKAVVGGKVVWLDLKQPAEGGVGPHGMVTGMTGSGKSKLLRSVVLSLAMQHPPEALQILLGDFKGEAEFTGLENLPHTVGVVSNLEDSAHKLDRFQDVIEGEMEIRQNELKRAGFESVYDYETARAGGAQLPPIGGLVLVLDEFSELLKIKPDMGPVFDQVGRLGRSLWVSILNASQRVETGKMSGLIDQQGYAIGLKVRDQGMSRRAIGSPAAYDELKNAPPGTAILSVDGEYTKFRAFYTKAPFQAPRKKKVKRTDIDGYVVDVHRFGSEVAPLPEDLEDITADDDLDDEQADQPAGADAPAVESVLVGQLARYGKGRLRRAMWLPALDDTPEIPLEELAREYFGRDFGQVILDGGLVVPIAREDNPRKHTQEIVTLDLSGPGGHLGIAGRTQIGKSMSMQSVMLALAHSHSPERVQFYGLDFGGGSLAARMVGLPHVIGIAGGGSPEKVGQIVIEVEKLLRERERQWDVEGLDITTFRARKFGPHPAAVPEDDHGDVFLIVDNVAALKNFSLDLHDRVVRLADNALAYGIHLMVTNDGWLSIKPALGDKLGSRIEHRLSQAVDSRTRDKDLARKMPDQPGRALQHNGLHMLMGAPYGHRDVIDKEGEAQATQDAVARIAEAWRALGFDKRREVKMLPDRIAYEDMGPAPRGTLKLGLGQNELSTVGIDLTRWAHFWGAGSNQSGRSTLIRTLLRSITETFAPVDPAAPSFDQAQIVLFESEYNVIDSLDERYKGAYANNPADIVTVCNEVAALMEQRRPPSELSDSEKRRWRPSMPRVFVVVDDLDQLNMLSAGGRMSALHPLTGAIARGRQIGFHVLAATQADQFYQTGKSNKVLQAMDLAGASVLVLDSDKRENYVSDVKGAARRPGRGQFWTRKDSQLVQVAETLPPDES